jgi:Na+/H+ antiporter NhaD/arsenite permease-like protein
VGAFGFRFGKGGNHTRILSRDFSVQEVTAPKRAINERGLVSLLWIVLIVVLVLALLGFFGRGRW